MIYSFFYEPLRPNQCQHSVKSIYFIICNPMQIMYYDQEFNLDPQLNLIYIYSTSLSFYVHEYNT